MYTRNGRKRLNELEDASRSPPPLTNVFFVCVFVALRLLFDFSEASPIKVVDIQSRVYFFSQPKSLVMGRNYPPGYILICRGGGGTVHYRPLNPVARPPLLWKKWNAK